MTQPLHEDDPAATFTMPDGRVIRNLSVEDYDKTYSDGAPMAPLFPDEKPNQGAGA